MFAFGRRLAQKARTPRHVNQFLVRWCANAMLAGGAGYTYWDQQGISEQDISRAIREFINTSKVFFDSHHPQPSSLPSPSPSSSASSSSSPSPSATSSKQSSASSLSSTVNSSSNDRLSNHVPEIHSTLSNAAETSHKKKCEFSKTLGEDWEQLIVKEKYQVWRQPVPNSSSYRYKVFGSFNDISPRDFFVVQMDTDYRKQWDHLIVRLEVVDRERGTKNLYSDFLTKPTHNHFDSGNEVIQWIMHYPYPMYCREYCYIRRALVLKKENLIVVISKGSSHPQCDHNAKSGKHVRVTDYESQMVIRPHRSFEELGFDYYLTYYDDPKAYIPMSAYNWIASAGLPGFVENLHKAALQLPPEKRHTPTAKKSLTSSEQKRSQRDPFAVS